MRKIAVVIILVSSLALFIFAAPLKAEIEHITLRVDGLACPFCAYGLEKKIIRLEGVSSYDVDMREGKVFVGLNPGAQIELNSLYKAVKEAGFTLRSISLQVKGKIQQDGEGLVLITTGSQEKFLLFENKAISQKYHQGELPRVLENNLEKKLLKAKEQGREILIEGIVHEHKGFLPGLSVDYLEIIE